MQTRSSLQRRSSSDSSDRLVASLKPPAWRTPPQQQDQPQQLPYRGYDLSKVDLFSHDPGPRPNPNVMRVIQAKLKVGAPNDVYEQEADRVAEQVMSTPDSAVQQTIQREAAPEAAEVDELTMKPPGNAQTQHEAIIPEEEEAALDVQTKPMLQREADGSLQAENEIEGRLHSSKSGGTPLPDEVRSFMEPRFGADFSHVRVQTGSEAVQMNQDLNAQAFTHKQDVYFGVGKAPGNNALTAHELTHVVQQTGAGQRKEAPKLNVQLKCSACDEEANVQRLLNFSSSLESIQRREVCDDEGVCRSEPDPEVSVDPNYTPAPYLPYKSNDQEPESGGAGGAPPEYQGGYKGSPPTPEERAKTPPPTPDPIPAPPPGYSWQVSYTAGALGACSCTWRCVRTPASGGEISDPDDRTTLPNSVTTIGVMSGIPGRPVSCSCGTLTDSEGNIWQSQPREIDHNMTPPQKKYPSGDSLPDLNQPN